MIFQNHAINSRNECTRIKFEMTRCLPLTVKLIKFELNLQKYPKFYLIGIIDVSIIYYQIIIKIKKIIKTVKYTVLNLFQTRQSLIQILIASPNERYIIQQLLRDLQDN